MSHNEYNICLVDDDKIYQFTAKKIIESTNLTKAVLSFYNGEEAIEFLKSNLQNADSIPDIIFLDINMPIKDGWEFLEEFKSILNDVKKRIVIYMVSSSVDDYDIKKSKEYSFVTDYIIKPINRERFEQLIEAAQLK